jgi:hypothetical protein
MVFDAIAVGSMRVLLSQQDVAAVKTFAGLS